MAVEVVCAHLILYQLAGRRVRCGKGHAIFSNIQAWVAVLGANALHQDAQPLGVNFPTDAGLGQIATLCLDTRESRVLGLKGKLTRIVVDPQPVHRRGDALHVVLEILGHPGGKGLSQVSGVLPL